MLHYLFRPPSLDIWLKTFQFFFLKELQLGRRPGARRPAFRPWATSYKLDKPDVYFNAQRMARSHGRSGRGRGEGGRRGGGCRPRGEGAGCPRVPYHDGRFTTEELLRHRRCVGSHSRGLPQAGGRLYMAQIFPRSFTPSTRSSFPRIWLLGMA